MTRQKAKSSQIDWATMALNIKSATNTTSQAISNNTDTNLASNGAAVTFTVATACYALVIVNVGTNSTTDYEFRPQIFLDGSLHSSISYAAAIGGGASNRTAVRSYTNVVALSAGAHTISAGVWVTSSTSANVPNAGANISAIVLGQVTA